jgi:phage regulator Rha-like protein
MLYKTVALTTKMNFKDHLYVDQTPKISSIFECTKSCYLFVYYLMTIHVIQIKKKGLHDID